MVPSGPRCTAGSALMVHTESTCSCSHRSTADEGVTLARQRARTVAETGTLQTQLQEQHQ